MTVDKTAMLSKVKAKVACKHGQDDFKKVWEQPGNGIPELNQVAVEAYNEAINAVLKNIKLTPAQRIDVSQLIIK